MIEALYCGRLTPTNGIIREYETTQLIKYFYQLLLIHDSSLLYNPYTMNWCFTHRLKWFISSDGA